MRLFKRLQPFRPRAGKGAAFVAEEFRIRAGFPQCSAVEFDESVLARGEL